MDTTDDDADRKEAGAVAMADVNGDGLDDLILAHRELGLFVQLNLGGTLGPAVMVHAAEKLNGLALGDVDGDGDLDLWAGGYQDTMFLFQNDGAGGFVDVSEASGLAAVETVPQKTDGTFADMDGDGDLDLYVNRATAPDATSEGVLNKLFRNDGTGRFEDVSSWLSSDVRLGLSWSSIWTDIDVDGDVDLYTANAEQASFGPSRLLRNDGWDGDRILFSDLSDSCACTTNNSPMGISVGDYDNDGFGDFFLSNTGRNQLLRNLGDGTFIDVTATVGGMLLEGPGHMTFGATWFDHGNDGLLDVFVASGPLHSGTSSPDQEEQADQLWINDGVGFVDMASVFGLAQRGDGRGVASGLMNDDGFLDLVLTNLGSPSHLYLAECTTSRALVLDLAGTNGNTFGIGARVVVETDQSTMVREVGSKSGWGGAQHPRAHFGLGDQKVVSVTIHWPSGSVQTVEVSPGIDGRITVVEE
jgi:hypothetical protein